MPIALGFIAIVMYGNLRGVKESGRVFAVPTYFFMLNMGVLLAYGVWKYLGGDLDAMTSYAEGVIEGPDDAGERVGRALLRRHRLRAGQGVRLRRRRGHRGGGDLERRAGVQGAGLEATPARRS